MKHDSIREQHIKRTLEALKREQSMVGQNFYDLKQEKQVNVNIQVDNSVANGMFKPDPKNPEGFIASDLTFRAMKKDIFAMADSVDEIKEPYQCASCKTDLDMQFWHFCPYCGGRFLV